LLVAALALPVAALAFNPPRAPAAVNYSDTPWGTASENVGLGVAINARLGVIFAGAPDSRQGGFNTAGTVYYWSDAFAGGTQTASFTLPATFSNGVPGDRMGQSLAIYDNGTTLSAVVGVEGYDTGAPLGNTPAAQNAGAVLYYADILGGAPPVLLKTPLADVTLSNNGDSFGYSVSLSSGGALIGAYYANPTQGSGAYNAALDYAGAVYFWANPAAGGDAYTTKLVSPNPKSGGRFGDDIALSGASALVGAPFEDSAGGGVTNAGNAYFWANANTATAANAVALVPSDAESDSRFGFAVALNGASALVGAPRADTGGLTDAGAAYYWANAAAGGAQTTKLVASDVAANGYLGHFTALSGTAAYVVGGIDPGTNPTGSGAIYYYADVTTGGVIVETVKLLVSDTSSLRAFGWDLSVDGTVFAAGAPFAYGYSGRYSNGSVVTGDIRTFTVLNSATPLTLSTGGVSFVSRVDWIIGDTASNQKVILARLQQLAGVMLGTPVPAWIPDVANVTVAGTGVYVGRQPGANDNTLQVSGTLKALDVFVGTGTAGENSGNLLQLDAASKLDGAVTLHLSFANIIRIADVGGTGGSVTAALQNLALIAGSGSTLSVLNYLGVSPDYALNDPELLERLVLVPALTGGGYTAITPKAMPLAPEPSTYAATGAALLLAVAALARRRRRQHAF
jgi:hypothetical protein